jgi:hypothetical protein
VFAADEVEYGVINQNRLYLAALLALAPVYASAQAVLEDAARDARVLLAKTAVLKSSAPKVPVQAKEPQESVIPHFQQKSFPAPAAGACGLKRYTLLDYELRSGAPGDRTRLTEMGAAVETTSPDCVRDYAVVQFIRGCVYHTRYSVATGAQLEKVFDVARHLRGPRVVFNHPTYEVDQMDLDPLYVADTEETDRLALLYVPHTPLRLRPDRASMLADLKAFDDPSLRTFLKDLDHPTALTYIADLPEGGVISIDEDNKTLSATNSSLDFKTCVYRVKDVPTRGDPAGPDAAPENGGPLQCFTWQSRYTYDPAAKDFATDAFAGVDPFCAQAPARVVLPGS